MLTCCFALSLVQYFYTMVVEKNIHQSGCACAQWLAGVPATIPVYEYAPCPDVDGMHAECDSIQAAYRGHLGDARRWLQQAV